MLKYAYAFAELPFRSTTLHTDGGSLMNYMNLMSERGADSAPCNLIFISTFGYVPARNGCEGSYLLGTYGLPAVGDGKMVDVCLIA